MKRCGLLLVLAWSFAACASERGEHEGALPSKGVARGAGEGPSEPREAARGPSVAGEAAQGPREPNEPREAANAPSVAANAPSVAVHDGVATPPERNPRAAGNRWRITAGDAEAAGLPPLAFSFDLTDSGLSGDRLRDGDYVMLSGPPGGPLSLRIAAATVGADPAALVRHGASTVTPQEVELLGARQRAVAWITGEGFTRTSWCGVVVAPPVAAEGAPALLVELGAGYSDDEVTCKTTVEHVVLGPIMKSLAFD